MNIAQTTIMSSTNLPQSNTLTTRHLNRVFDKTVATYKFYITENKEGWRTEKCDKNCKSKEIHRLKIIIKFSVSSPLFQLFSR